MSEHEDRRTGLQKSSIKVEFSELSSKQRGVIKGILKDTGFSIEEIREVSVRISDGQDAELPQGE